MVAVEEPRYIEVGANVLNDDVRRVAPAANGDIAIGKRKTLRCGRVGAPYHLDGGPRGMGERRRVQRPDPLQVLAHLAGYPLLPLCRPIAQLRAKRGALARIETERGRGFGCEPKQVFRDLI